MLNRSLDGETQNRKREDSRVRIAIPRSIEKRLQRRMEQDDMRGQSLTAYLNHLIKMDTGAYV